MRVLYIEPDEHFAEASKRLAAQTRPDVELCPVADGLSARALFDAQSFDLIVSELLFPPEGSKQEEKHYMGSVAFYAYVCGYIKHDCKIKPPRTPFALFTDRKRDGEILLGFWRAGYFLDTLGVFDKNKTSIVDIIDAAQEHFSPKAASGAPLDSNPPATPAP